MTAEPPASARDEPHMRLALALGARHLGLTWPNPSVGAVVVGEGPHGPLIIAQGITQPGGRPHAERIALQAAGARARGATLYVSLEPCSHHGRSPPCVDAILTSGVSRVVSALEDPDPRVHGLGHARLREAGITVTTGCLADEARRLHRGHITRVREGRPAVTVKLARTTEGFAGARQGPRLMITGPIANARTHLMRAHADALLVGIGTVLADDPRLDVRLPGIEDRTPIRVVMDSQLRLSPEMRLVRSAREMPIWVITNVAAPTSREQALVAAGVEVLRVDSDPHGRPALAEALQLLGARGLTRVFCEGGPELAEGLAQAGLVDELVLVTGGSGRGRGDVPALGPALAEIIDNFQLMGEKLLDFDLFMSWERP